jgi:hypothetical protein
MKIKILISVILILKYVLMCEGMTTEDLVNGKLLPMLGIQSVSALDATTLRIQFTDEVEKASAENIANYNLKDENDELVPLNSALIDEVSPSIVLLTTTDLTQSDNYTLTVYNVAGKSKTRPIGSNGISIKFSGVAGALVDTTPPNALSPPDGAIVGMNPVIIWTSKSGAAYYELEVAKDEAYSDQINESPFPPIYTPITSKKLDLTSEGSGTYYWRVRADTTAEGLYAEGYFEVFDDFIYVYCPASFTNCDDSDIYDDGTNVPAVGHISKPFPTVSGGIAEAVREGKSYVLIAGRGDSGNTAYMETIIINDGVSLIGGYNDTFTEKNPQQWPVTIKSQTSFVALASSVLRNTRVESIAFVNDSTGLNITYGVKIDGSTSSLLFTDVIIDGGSGNSAFGIANINSSDSFIEKSTIYTQATLEKAIGIFNDSSSILTLNAVNIYTGSSIYTIGIQNELTVHLTDTSITTGDAMFYSTGIGGLKEAAGIVNIISGQIISGDVSHGANYGIFAEDIDIENCIISNGSGMNYRGIKICKTELSSNVSIINNIFNNSGKSNGSAIEICNNNVLDDITVKNNTISLGGAANKGIVIGSSNDSSQLLSLSNNLIFDPEDGAFDAGFDLGTDAIDDITSNIIWNLQDYAVIGNENYSQICSAQFTPSAQGSFGRVFILNEVSLHPETSGLPNDRIDKIYASGADIYVSAGSDGFENFYISNDSGTTFTQKTTLDGLGDDVVNDFHINGEEIFLATNGGVSIATDGGTIFDNKTFGLESNTVLQILADGTNVFAVTASFWPLSVSSDSGNSYVPAQNLVSGQIPKKVLADGIYVYVTYESLMWVSVSSDSGLNFTTKDQIAIDMILHGSSLIVNAIIDLYKSDDQGDTFNSIVQPPDGEAIFDAVSDGSNIYAVTTRGLDISADDGATFSTKGIADGLAITGVGFNVFTSGTNVYAYGFDNLSVSVDSGSTFRFKKLFFYYPITSNYFASDPIAYFGTTGGLFTFNESDDLFSNKTTDDGLGSNNVRKVFVLGSKVYAATGGGLSISDNGGATFTNRTTEEGLGSDSVWNVFVSGGKIYAATHGGLSISSDGGDTFINKTTSDGLSHDIVGTVYVSGKNVYAGTEGGLSISTDGGNTFTHKTTSDGLGANKIMDVFMHEGILYAGTDYGGLAVSTNGGVSFMQVSMENGLGSNLVSSINYSGSDIYVGTAGGLSVSTDGGDTYSTLTAEDGLAGNNVYNLHVSGSDIFIATSSGLCILTVGDKKIVKYTAEDGLGSVDVKGVFKSGSVVYAATAGGLSISKDRNEDCIECFESSIAGSTTGNTTAALTTGATGSGAVFDENGFLFTDPSTWEILAGGPADIGTVPDSWDSEDIGADAANAGVSDGETPGAEW